MELLHGDHDPQNLFSYEDLEVLTNKFTSSRMHSQADEINFLRKPIMESHPNSAKVQGYCFDGYNFGVVFDLNPLNTIRNLVAERPFTWFHRMKVALALVRLVQFLHGQQPRYLLRNLAAAHIMLDQDYNPVLIDCAMILGGNLGDTERARTGCPLGSHGYIDGYQLTTTGEWSERNDVYSFGTILVELIVKCRVDGFEDFKDGGIYYLYQVVRHLYSRLQSLQQGVLQGP